MQIVFDFIAGDIPFDEFWDAYCADLKIGKWLDGIADFSQEPPPQICKDIMLLGIYRTVQSDYHGHIRPSTYLGKECRGEGHPLLLRGIYEIFEKKQG